MLRILSGPNGVHAGEATREQDGADERADERQAQLAP